MHVKWAIIIYKMGIEREKNWCVAKIGQFKLIVMTAIYINILEEKRRKQTQNLIKIKMNWAKH